MIKVDIINEVAKAADITKVRAEVAVEAVLEAMKDSLMKGERIELRGFGVFQVKPRKRGIGRNPRPEWVSQRYPPDPGVPTCRSRSSPTGHRCGRRSGRRVRLRARPGTAGGAISFCSS
jgi:DNA-binding protein HU-beta